MKKSLNRALHVKTSLLRSFHKTDNFFRDSGLTDVLTVKSRSITVGLWSTDVLLNARLIKLSKLFDDITVENYANRAANKKLRL